MSGFLENLKSQYAHDATVLAGIENGSVRGIPLTRGKIAIVDAEDFEWLNQWKWCALKGKYTFYAMRIVEKKGIKFSFLMHREILKLKKGDKIITDHKNRNGCDNRKNNIRTVTITINNHNSRLQRNNSSGYRGVSWKKDKQKWKAYLMVNNKQVHLGYFTDIKSAALAYDNKVIEIRDMYASTNITERSFHV